MNHGCLIRIIFKDDQILVGGYDLRLSNTYKIFLIGHSHCYWRRQIKDAFVFKEEKWHRVIGERTFYDNYIENGGEEWPKTFLKTSAPIKN